MEKSARPGAPAGNTATGALKLIALVFMIIDHCGKMFFPSVPEMRILGRIAFPLYVWCMVVGFYYTRNTPRYLLRVLLTGVLSQPLYVYALNHRWTEPNIFLTLFLGLAALWSVRENRFGSRIWGPVLAICLATVLNANYGWQGVLLFLLLYAVRESRPGIAAVMVAYFLFWGTSYSITRSFFGIPLLPEGTPDFLFRPLSAFLRLETFGLLALPMMLIPFPKDLRMPRWLGYALYPAHLAVIILIRILIGSLGIP